MQADDLLPFFLRLVFLPFSPDADLRLYQCIGRRRKSVDPLVRGFPVAVEAGPLLKKIMKVRLDGIYEFRAHYFFMAAYAVALDYFLSGIPDVDHLRFGAQCENTGMP